MLVKTARVLLLSAAFLFPYCKGMEVFTDATIKALSEDVGCVVDVGSNDDSLKANPVTLIYRYFDTIFRERRINPENYSPFVNRICDTCLSDRNVQFLSKLPLDECPNKHTKLRYRIIKVILDYMRDAIGLRLPNFEGCFRCVEQNRAFIVANGHLNFEAHKDTMIAAILARSLLLQAIYSEELESIITIRAIPVPRAPRHGSYIGQK